MFPEGGIWDPGAKPAKRGVAWLSYQVHAPILPIGFGGVEGALNAIFGLQRPKLTMNVGQPMPPVTLKPGVPRKKCLQDAAEEIMRAVNALIPEQDRERQPERQDEQFELQVYLHDALGNDVPLPGPGILHADALGKMFYRPAILRIFKMDLRLPVEPLQDLGAERDPRRIAEALQLVLRYVEESNPDFFTYRFGMAEGLAMEAGLRELHDLAQQAADAGHRLTILPVRRYRLPGREDEVVESDPGRAHRW